MPIIPTGAFEIQTGLYLLETPRPTYTYRELYSADGYCFYDKNDIVCDPETGDIIPDEDVLPTQRVYAQYASLSGYYTSIELINEDFVSVPVQEGFEIVSAGNDHETV